MKTSLGSLVEEARWDFACGVVMMGRSEVQVRSLSIGVLPQLVDEGGRRRRKEEKELVSGILKKA